MRVSSKSKIAFNVLLDIAAHTLHGHAISMPLISKRHGLSISYLELIFAALRTAGMIQSHRGPGGGYSLARKPEEISLKEVMDVIQGTQSYQEDLGAKLWTDLHVFMQEQIAQVSLAKALSQSTITIEPSTKGSPVVRRAPELKVKTPAVIATLAKRPKVKKAPLGPNSVFTFGKYLQFNKS
ncbi:RrF2 family transcriptional regulator [Polynucleobacter antarcticus]|uniref:Rrf2 family transcriptional regulator n=1 Tax=Polynucleobacter antarcticus TaxID=1743162 RepID=A0A6M9PJT5_9BURK|nr:Rrf2 family transcriptional regulator [Polynucleobacter antarcticus]QKM63160.1 hypothetical protein DCO16_08920 [Polynucleobacter antarcticus]